MFFAGRSSTTAGRFNTELDVATFRAGQKVRVSELDETFAAGERLRAWELNQAFETGSGGGDPDPTPGGTPANPGEALWIGNDSGKNHFNIGIGDTDALHLSSGWSSDDHDDYDQDAIEGGFSESPKFFVLPSGNMQFRIGVNDGRTSTGTSYPRSELRELELDGDNAAWNGSSGTHYMKGRSRITRVAATKPSVCFFQIHDSSSDLVRVQTESGGDGPTGLRIRARRTPPSGGSEITTTIRSAYTLGDWMSWDIRIVSGTLSITLDGTQVLSAGSFGTTGCYFKTGCYAQSNTSTEGGDDSQFFIVEMEKGSLQCWHTGYATPTTPVFTG